MRVKATFILCTFLGIICHFAAASVVRIQVSNSLTRRLRCSGIDYPGLGCFSLDPPFTNTNWLPQRPSFVNTGFLLYTRANPTQPDRLHADVTSSISGSHFNVSQPVKFLVHGFLQYGRSEFLVNMTKALLEKAPMNVIVVAWGGGAGFPYTQAVANTRLVGAEIARLVSVLAEVTGLTPEQVHIIGHSLGAHVAGYTGSRIPGLGRITALDPAQPNFQGYDEAVRLDSTDARFVDVIHTDAVPYDTFTGYGMIEPVGHIDFYPNGGKDQPGCHEDHSVLDFMEDAFSNGMTDAENALSCSHERSAELFTMSVMLSSAQGPSPCSFTAFPCDSQEKFLNGECLHCGNRPCPVMGLDADKSYRSRGVFFLNTTGMAPFCGYHYFVTLSVAPTMTYTDGIIFVNLEGTNGRTNWEILKSGRLNGGDVITNLIMSGSNIGEITEVGVRFVSEAGYFSWGEDHLVVRRVDVNSIMRFPTKYFCQAQDMTVLDGHELTLTPGTYSQSECN